MCLRYCAPSEPIIAETCGFLLQGTYYGDQSGSGHCSFQFSNSFTLAWTTGVYTGVAINEPQYGTSAPCGMCLAFWGTGAGDLRKPDCCSTTTLRSRLFPDPDAGHYLCNKHPQVTNMVVQQDLEPTLSPLQCNTPLPQTSAQSA